MRMRDDWTVHFEGRTSAWSELCVAPFLKRPAVKPRAAPHGSGLATVYNTICCWLLESLWVSFGQPLLLTHVARMLLAEARHSFQRTYTTFMCPLTSPPPASS